MIKILFVCYGNICRSPMTLMIFKDIIKSNGCSDKFLVSSCATSSEEIGNDIYPPIKEVLKEKGISIEKHNAKQFKKEFYNIYDYIIVMDGDNKFELLKYFDDNDNENDNKIHLLLEYTNDLRNIDDPWFTRDFETAFKDIYNGCLGFYKYLIEREKYGKMEDTK